MPTFTEEERRVFANILAETDTTNRQRDEVHELMKPFVAQVLGALPEPFTRRLADYFESLGRSHACEHPLQVPTMLHFRDLTAKPWWKATDHPQLAAIQFFVELAYPTLREEFEAANVVMTRHASSDRYPGIKGDSWKTFALIKGTEVTDEARKVFPRTLRILEPIFGCIAEDIRFLTLAPHMDLPGHTDASNAQINCQLGFQVPPDCAIKVGTEAHTWEEGKCIFFDPSFAHKAWNHSDRTRVVLLFDLHHPELTELERSVLKMAIRNPNANAGR